MLLCLNWTVTHSPPLSLRGKGTGCVAAEWGNHRIRWKFLPQHEFGQLRGLHQQSGEPDAVTSVWARPYAGGLHTKSIAWVGFFRDGCKGQGHRGGGGHGRSLSFERRHHQYVSATAEKVDSGPLEPCCRACKASIVSIRQGPTRVGGYCSLFAFIAGPDRGWDGGWSFLWCDCLASRCFPECRKSRGY